MRSGGVAEAQVNSKPVPPLLSCDFSSKDDQVRLECFVGPRQQVPCVVKSNCLWKASTAASNVHEHAVVEHTRALTHKYIFGKSVVL